MRICQRKIYLKETTFEGATWQTRSRVRQLSEIILEPMAVESFLRLTTAAVDWSLSDVALYAQTTPIRSEICLVKSRCFLVVSKGQRILLCKHTFDLNKSMSEKSLVVFRGEHNWCA